MKWNFILERWYQINRVKKEDKIRLNISFH